MVTTLPLAPTPALRKAILRTFTHKYNLQLHASALSFIAGILEEHDLQDQQEQCEDALEALAKGVVDSEGSLDDTGSSSVVTRAVLEHVYDQLVVNDTANIMPQDGMVHGLTEGEEADPHRYFNVIDSFKMPRVTFDASRKVFVKSVADGAHSGGNALTRCHRSATAPTILPNAAAQPGHMRERLNILKNVILRNENFLPPLAIGHGKEREHFLKLTSTKNLLGRQGQRFLLFGILSIAQDGRYALEDTDGTVGLELEDAIPGEGIFTEGSCVLVEGRYTEEERFQVFMMGNPPSEPRAMARQTCGHVDFLGTGAVTPQEEVAMRVHEQAHEDLCIVVISDLHLDHQPTLANFRAMLQGYVDADFLPFAFVLCGNFSSAPNQGGDAIRRYQESFSQLADILLAFPDIVRSSHLIFVPGPADPFVTPLLPRAPLPDVLIDRLRTRLGVRARVHFTSNPCRLRYFGQEIVVYRDDAMARMLRNTVTLKDEAKESDLKKYLVSTILDQAHLCPLPQQIRPVLWEYDHTLRLYPMPTALVLADRYERFELTYEGCHVFNPGSFRGSSFGWTTYYPGLGKAERSELPRV